MSHHPELKGFQPDPVVSGLPAAVRVYVVGGAVRDALLGRLSADRDWVVVGASVDDMSNAGFTPVGSDFPVFLHPQSKEEYALARTERKSGHGYKGFTFHADPSVTLEEDLARRDFTVNAMAMTAEGDLIDPFGGFNDLQNKLMRHVSPAFTEDPLRVLRLARFLARFLDFSVAEETMRLCRQLRDSGELKHLVAERVYAELNKGMGEEKPSRMIKLITKLNAWTELAANCQVPFAEFGKAEFDGLNQLKTAESRWMYALGFFLSTSQIKLLCKAWRLPRDLEDLAVVTSNFYSIEKSSSFNASAVGQFLNQVDVYRKPARLRQSNRLMETLLGPSALTRCVEHAIRDVEQGQYKAFLSDKLSHIHAGESVAEVAAKARQSWIDELHSKYF